MVKIKVGSLKVNWLTLLLVPRLNENHLIMFVPRGVGGVCSRDAPPRVGRGRLDTPAAAAASAAILHFQALFCLGQCSNAYNMGAASPRCFRLRSGSSRLSARPLTPSSVFVFCAFVLLASSLRDVSSWLRWLFSLDYYDYCAVCSFTSRRERVLPQPKRGSRRIRELWAPRDSSPCIRTNC